MRHARCVVLGLLLAAELRAQEPTLTEESFLAAVAEGPALAILAEERARAQAEQLRAGLLANPGLEVAREAPDGAARETIAALTWTPPIGGRRALRREAAEHGLAAAERRLDVERLRLRLVLREAYAGWALAAERRDLAAARLGRVGQLAARERRRAEAGEVPGLAARRLALEEAEAQADLGLAEAELARWRAEVTAWAPELSAGARPALPQPPPIPGALVLAAAPPAVEARRLEAERAETLRRLAGRVFEAPELGLGWKRIEEQRAGEASGPVVSAVWTLPLFDRRQADRLEAEARLAAARAELALATRRAAAERAGALAAYERLAREAVQAAAAAGAAGAVEAGAEAAFRLGESGVTDLLDALRAAAAARTTARELRAAALAAHRALEAAAGRPLPLAPAAGDQP